ncbi:hypothetical protein T4E_4317 [Trichinella pseudospiralis]|uniref:Uncharacterized protein n=1 Tax=Trichinella pseudospiralis TaxID=6337 RepID=A0A0V0Y7X5_TRIPS|nr:hypothetical protein T4E_4317 [Trichinella pseudospiralis]
MQSVVKHQRYYKKRDVFAFDYRSVYPNMPWPDDRVTRTQIGADDDDDDVHLQCIHNWTNLGL